MRLCRIAWASPTRGGSEPTSASHPGSPEGHRSAFGHASQGWVAKVLVGDIVGAIVGAAMLAPTIQAAGFNLHTTRDIDVAKYSVRSRYEDEDARYGLLASNKDRSLPRFGRRNDYSIQKKLKNHIGPQFIDPPDSRRSCRRLDDAAAPVGWQGLEMDFPIVRWVATWWDGTEWAIQNPCKS
jgi:hypothetical protein